MESRVKETIVRHDKGYNCAQAVACTYCDLFGYKEEDVFRMTEGFGLGMGCMAGTCGALSGAVLLAGALRFCHLCRAEGRDHRNTGAFLCRLHQRCGCYCRGSVTWRRK